MNNIICLLFPYYNDNIYVYTLLLLLLYNKKIFLKSASMKIFKKKFGIRFKHL